jgi:hypothetical protein
VGFPPTERLRFVAESVAKYGRSGIEAGYWLSFGAEMLEALPVGLEPVVVEATTSLLDAAERWQDAMREPWAGSVVAADADARRRAHIVQPAAVDTECMIGKLRLADFLAAFADLEQSAALSVEVTRDREAAEVVFVRALDTLSGAIDEAAEAERAEAVALLQAAERSRSAGDESSAVALEVEAAWRHIAAERLAEAGRRIRRHLRLLLAARRPQGPAPDAGPPSALGLVIGPVTWHGPPVSMAAPRSAAVLALAA